ncbi:MAG: hypothetical protein WDA16_11775 [Candidatus Thermoplasmatota archaeon]
MSFRPVLALLAIAPLLAAGCVAPSAILNKNSVAPDLALLPSATSLWPDHENEPHPSYGWPTLTHPATSTGEVPAFWKPIPEANVTKITGLKHITATPGITKGAGIALFGSLALVPADSGKDSYVVDISNPEKPTILSTYPVNNSERGAAFMPFPDGRLYAIVATGPGFDVVNLTDPRNPYVLTDVKPLTGGHKVGVVPGTPIVYNANSNGGGGPLPLGAAAVLESQAAGVTEIYDLSDPASPVLVQNFKNGYGCHHIFFWIDETKDKERAICPGIQMTQIWDIKDPKDPKVIVSIPVHYGVAGGPSASIPLMAFSHFGILDEKGEQLIVGDEMGGGGVPPGCTAPGAPTGALWFYDVKDEKNPKLEGWFSPGTFLASKPGNDPMASCTAHHGRLVPDPEGKRQLIAMAFYGAGTVLVDFTDPMMPQLVDQWDDGTNTWEAWYYNGYIFTGDLARGMDILKLR